MDPDREEIRLLCLLPGASGETLQASLLVFSLCAERSDHILASLGGSGIPFEKSNPSPPPYEALSYVWGARTREGCLSLREYGRCALPITDNLAAALRRLRYKDYRRVLWVDALCINQKGNVEKSQQVILMAEIYSRAARVLVWLGDTDEPEIVPEPRYLFLYPPLQPLSHDPADTEWDLFALWEETYDTEDSEPTDAWVHLPSSFRKRQLLRRGILSRLDDWRARSLKAAFVGNPTRDHWFQRIWVMQEFLQARNMPVACFGELELPWNDLQYYMDVVT